MVVVPTFKPLTSPLLTVAIVSSALLQVPPPVPGLSDVDVPMTTTPEPVMGATSGLATTVMVLLSDNGYCSYEPALQP